MVLIAMQGVIVSTIWTVTALMETAMVTEYATMAGMAMHATKVSFLNISKTCNKSRFSSDDTKNTGDTKNYTSFDVCDKQL